MNWEKFYGCFLIVLIIITQCGNPNGSSSGVNSLSKEEKIRLKQYSVQGAKLYTTYCANCHQQDGKGLASLYPPLANADYLLEDLPRAACIIKYGLLEEIVVNGKTYNQMMPGNEITNLEIAEILTYIGNSWGNQAGLTNVKDVSQWLKDCEE